MTDTARDQQAVAVTAFIAALAEGLRLLGRRGATEDQLYASVSRLSSRPAFDMVVAELVAQKTVRRDGERLVYCGPLPLSEGGDA